MGGNSRVNKPEKSKDSPAFELFLQGKQSVEVAIELDISADKVEELFDKLVNFAGAVSFE